MSKAIVDKADTASIVMKVTDRERTLLKPILKTAELFGTPEPNVSISLYKNRGGKFTNIKIWLLVDYSTMRVRDLFVTDYEYNIIKMAKTYIGVDEDERKIVTTSKDELNKLIKAREEAINIIDDGSSNALDDLLEKDIEEDGETDSEPQEYDNNEVTVKNTKLVPLIDEEEEIEDSESEELEISEEPETLEDSETPENSESNEDLEDFDEEEYEAYMSGMGTSYGEQIPFD